MFIYIWLFYLQYNIIIREKVLIIVMEDNQSLKRRCNCYSWLYSLFRFEGQQCSMVAWYFLLFHLSFLLLIHSSFYLVFMFILLFDPSFASLLFVYLVFLTFLFFLSTRSSGRSPPPLSLYFPPPLLPPSVLSSIVFSVVLRGRAADGKLVCAVCFLIW